MRALVTGGCGFVGQHLIDHLLNAGDQVVATVLPGRTVERNCELVELDVVDRDRTTAIIRQLKPDVIYHLAGITFIPDAAQKFSETLKINVGGTENICVAARGVARKLVFISTAQVYGRVAIEELPVTETTRVAPATHYALSKMAAEFVVRRFSGIEFETVTFRPFNHFGPGQSDSFVVSSFAKQIAEIAKSKREPVIQVGNLEPKRDFSDVRDIVRAYRLGAVSGSGVFNLGSGSSLSIAAILQKLIAISGVAVKVEIDPLRLRRGETPDLFAGIEQVRSVLNWSPEIALDRSLADVYKDWVARV